MANVFWEVDFDWKADRMGLIDLKIQLKNRNGTTTSWALIAQLQVFKDWTPELKASRMVNLLRQRWSSVFEVQYVNGSDDFKIRLMPNPPRPYQNWAEIHGIQKVDAQTGEGMTGVIDDPVEGEAAPMGFGFFHLSGVGDQERGVVQLQLGKQQPLIEVDSYQRSDEEIINALINQFNKSYAELGFQATREVPRLELALEDSPGLMIPELPCPLGIRAGCRDTGFISQMGYVLY